MIGFYFKFKKIRQDLQDLLDILNTLFPPARHRELLRCGERG